MSVHYLKTCMTSVEDVNAFANKAWHEITNGEVDPLDLLTIKKFFELYFDQLLKDHDVSKAVDTEVDKHGKDCVHMGMKITKASRPVYSFDGCGDSTWNEYNTLLKDLKERIKEREAFLKALPNEVADTDTGEVIKPPTYKTTDYYILK